jgi:hypothetical protein
MLYAEITKKASEKYVYPKLEFTFQLLLILDKCWIEWWWQSYVVIDKEVIQDWI